MTARCICPPPVKNGGRRREAVQLDECPVHGEEARAGWGEEPCRDLQPRVVSGDPTRSPQSAADGQTVPSPTHPRLARKAHGGKGGE